MVNKIYNDNDEKINKISSSKNSPIHLSKEPTFTPKNYNTDDIIKSLSNAYENKRARQVIEWERVQYQNMSQMI